MTGTMVSEVSAAETVARRFDASIEATTRFFEQNVDWISATSLEMARRFEQGGRLIVFGSGAAATDAQHVSVEFIHPVIVGKRALPAIALTSDVASVTASSVGGGFRAMISALAREEDIALGILGDVDDQTVTEALSLARNKKLLTISIGPEKGAPGENPEQHQYRVPSNDPLVAQEVSETFYHVLWELVHLFLEHRPAGSASSAP
ncbi:MAG TPA: SIS domain-containing protein [Gemmatimonadaceae bacterium]|nr:SIS domain-containing protein [Gemmatimonadaceae bacterium]